MSDDRHCVARVTISKDKQKYNCISVWSTKFPGVYSLSRDKASDKYPAMGLVEAIKAFAAGEIFVDVRVEGESGGRRNDDGSGF
jgi:hypothetical protein